MTLPSDDTKRKQIPLYSGLMKYFPDALAAVAHLSWKGNEQHNPGEPLHWAREKSSGHLDSLARHLLGIEESLDDATAVAWRALANLQLAIEKEKQNGDDAEYIVGYAEPQKIVRIQEG